MRSNNSIVLICANRSLPKQGSHAQETNALLEENMRRQRVADLERENERLAKWALETTDEIADLRRRLTES